MPLTQHEPEPADTLQVEPDLFAPPVRGESADVPGHLAWLAQHRHAVLLRLEGLAVFFSLSPVPGAFLQPASTYAGEEVLGRLPLWRRSPKLRKKKKREEEEKEAEEEEEKQEEADWKKFAREMTRGKRRRRDRDEGHH